jgi:integrase/recombinase XerD
MEVERLSLLLVHDLKRLVEEFGYDCLLRNMTAESVRRYKSCLLIFGDFLSDRGATIREVDRWVLREFLQYVRFDRRVKEKTVENYFSAMSAFYDYLIFEELLQMNPVSPFRKRYLRSYKDDASDPERKLLTVEEMSILVNSILDPRDRAVAILFAKTGIRRNELLSLDVDDVNWVVYSITLKETPKRSNRVVFFDDECAFVLKRWLKVREKLNPRTKALFISYQSLNRFDRNGLYTAVVKYATNLGFHNLNSAKLEDHFSPHCFRHWFTTWLRRSGMPREFVKELRGDRRKEAMDIYDHIDRDELRRAYLACIPKLGI